MKDTEMKGQHPDAKEEESRKLGYGSDFNLTLMREMQMKTRCLLASMKGAISRAGMDVVK